MLNYNNSIRTKVFNLIFSNIIILLFFLFWFVYSTFNAHVSMIFISSYFLIVTALILSFKYLIHKNKDLMAFTSYILIYLIPIIFLLDLLFSFIPNTNPFLFSFYDLIGIKHSFKIYVFLPLLTLIFVKIFIIFIYFLKNTGIFEMGKGDEVFHYFTNNMNNEKLFSLTLLFPLSAFVEELIYRSLVLTALIYYFDFNMGMGILIGSVLFSLVHTVALKDTGQIISLLISSSIYFIALIQLGILYAWFFHLITNFFVLLFYYQRRRRDLKHEN